MSEPIIEVEGLSKLYRLGATIRHDTLRDAIAHRFWSLLGKAEDTKQTGRDEQESIWALKDVSFDVREGEVLGIIGRNGAGKSTLLKILSRVTDPTEGAARLRGRVASLLEVGTGFHPELTGRENVYLSGTILGMTRSEIRSRFDEIVAFSEIEKFLDTPVKRYSSGMYVRLAFAVAAHLEPEILIVDEVLAVGDFAFQKKCLDKMESISRRGKAVLFVSHNLLAVRNLCQKAIFLQDGRVAFNGGVKEAVDRYTYESSRATTGISVEEQGAVAARVSDVVIRSLFCYQDGGDKDMPEIGFGNDIMIEFEYEALTRIENPVFRVNIGTKDRTVFANIDTDKNGLPLDYIVGRGKISLRIIHQKLYPGDYVIHLAVVSEKYNRHLFLWNWAKIFIIKPVASKVLCYPAALVHLDAEITQEEVHG